MHASLGIVFQNYALFPHMTVAQNVAYGPQAAGRTRAETAATVTAMLDTVQMGAFRDRLPRQLSGGQQQRVALARCLAIRPAASCCWTSRSVRLTRISGSTCRSR